MKKVLLFLPAFFVGSLFAQNAIQTTATPSGKTFNRAAAVQRSNPGNSTAATTLFSENFATGLPATWSIVNNAATTEIWHYTTTGSFNALSGGALNPVGTTAANGYMIFDSDSSGVAGVPENCDLITPAINCTGQSTVFLSFNQYYREYMFDSCLVGISTDNVNWTYIYTPDTAVVAGNTPNADHLTLNISSIAGNQATVYVKFHWEGDWDWFWLIDDVMMYVPNPTEVATTHVDAIGAEYTMIPLTQASNITLKGTIQNLGSSTVSNATAKFEVIDTVSNAVVFTNIVSVPSMNSLGVAAVSTNWPFSAPAIGYYRSRLTVIAGGDVDTTNNVSSATGVVHVTDSVYARDNGIQTGSLGIGAGPSNGIIGQNFTINANDQLTSITFWMNEMTFNTGGTPVYFTIHPQTPGSEPSAAIASTDSLIVTTGTIATGGQWFTLNMNGGPLQLTPGIYYVGGAEVDSILTLGTTPTIFTPNTVWVTWSTIPTPPAVNGWATAEAFNFSIAYLLRMNLGPNPLGIPTNESNSTTSVYPNPSNGILNVGTGANGKDNVVVNVYDVTGAIVYSTQTINSEIKIDLSAQAAGVYFVQINNGGNVINKKITITK